MKNLLTKHAVLLLTVCLGLMAKAEITTYPYTDANGINYTLNYSVDAYGQATLSAVCDGVNPEVAAEFNPTNFAILSTIEYEGKIYPVTEIASYAFQGCVKLTGELVFPETVKKCGFGSFDQCSGLTGTLDLSNFVGRSIFNYTFRGCSGFNKLIMGEKIESMGIETFSGCSGFTGELDLSHITEVIGEAAFKDCKNFTSLKLGDNIKQINIGAFQNCSGLKGSLKIPDGVSSIPKNAFDGCTGFDGTLEIGNKVSTIGDNAFHNCLRFIGNLDLKNVTSVGPNAFQNCKSFNGNLNLNNVKTINEYAFQNCSGFVGDLNIPSTVTTMGIHAFEGCSGFNGELKLDAKITTLTMCVFSDCKNLKGNLVIPNTVTNIQSLAFDGCSGFDGELILSDNLRTLASAVFQNCSNLKGRISLPATLQTMNTSVFKGCKNITSVEFLGENVTIINKETFSGCENLKSIQLPSALQDLKEKAFYGCTGLNIDFIIPETVTNIGKNCFSNSGITGVVIPDLSNLTVDKTAFADMNNCQWIISLADVPSANIGIDEGTPLYVHTQVVDAYKEALPEHQNIYPILAVDDVELAVNGSAEVTYKYQPELTDETHQAILQLTPAHKGESIEWSAADVEQAQNAPIATMDAGSSIISFEPSTLTVKALSAGTANIIANDGVNKAVATVNVSAQPEEECDCCQPGDSDAQIRDRIYMIPDENMDLTELLGELSASSWTTTDDAVVTVSDAGEAHALQYGEVYVRAKDVDDKTLAVIMISVCPTITVEHGAGVVYAHHVPYNTRPTLLVAPGGGYKISGITHDGEDINSELVASDGKYVPEKPITANSVINLSLEQDPSSGPTTRAASVMSYSDIRIYVNGHNVRIVGAQPGSVVVMTNLEGKELFRAKRYDVDVIDAGVYVITVEGHPGPFKILVR